MEPIWKIVPAEQSHIPHLTASMREADRREVWASSRQTPDEALRVSLSSSFKALTAFVNDMPAQMWGVAPSGSIYSFIGTPWLLATDDINLVTVDFIRLSRRYAADLQHGFSRLENYVHADNALSIRWLKWCGFQLDETPTIINDENFFRFWRDASC